MRVVICGGGISGLASTYYASRLLPKICGSNFKITLLEKEKSLGGWMKTRCEQDSISEWGPHSVRFSGKSATLQERNCLALMNELGLDDLILPVTGESIAAKNRLIYANEQLHTLPTDLMSASLPTSLHTTPLAAYLLKSIFKRVPKDMELVHDIASIKMGKKVADLYASSFIRGIFAADSKKVSMKAAFPAMWKRIHKYPSDVLMDFETRHNFPNANKLKQLTSDNPLVKRAMSEDWRMWTSQYGLQDMCQKIAQQICQTSPNVEIVRNSNVREISQSNNGKMTVMADTENGSLLLDELDHVVSALPSHALGDALNRGNVDNVISGGNLRKVARWLADIKWVDVAVVHVEFPGSPSHLLPNLGFGHLVPSTEKSNILGVIYDSCLFPQQDRKDMSTTRLTCMMGGSWFKQILGPDPDDVSSETINKMALDDISKQLGINQQPLHIQSFICRKCIPLYEEKHTDLVRKVEYLIERKDIPLSLTGSSYWGVSVNDCVYNSRAVLSKLFDTEDKRDDDVESDSMKNYILSKSFVYRKLKGIERK